MPIITCHNREYNILYDDDNTSSEYIKDVVKSFGNVDVVIPIPDKYYSVVSNYVEYLRDNETPIINKRQLLLCFQLNTLFIDDKYFKYLVQQTFNTWSSMCTMVYNDFNDDLQWSFFVHSPYDFVPKHLLDNNSFMKQWNKLNQNIITKVNNNSETYYNNVETFDKYNQKIITIYHTINGKSDIGVTGQIDNEMNFGTVEIGYKRETIYCKDNIIKEINYDNNVRDGPLREWYNGEKHTLRCEGYFVDGKKHGVWREWYNTQREINEKHTEDIPKEKWLRCACRHTLKYEGYYVDGKENGFWIEWYNNVHHTLESAGHFVDGKENGLWTDWYNDDKQSIDSEGHYVDGEQHGHWIEYDLDGNVTFDGEYVNGVKVIIN